LERFRPYCADAEETRAIEKVQAIRLSNNALAAYLSSMPTSPFDSEPITNGDGPGGSAKGRDFLHARIGMLRALKLSEFTADVLETAIANTPAEIFKN
jgi:hypothetical protein